MMSALSARQNCTSVRKTHYKHNEDGRMAPGVRSHGSVPLSHSGNVVTRTGLHTHTHSILMNSEKHSEALWDLTLIFAFLHISPYTLIIIHTVATRDENN